MIEEYIIRMGFTLDPKDVYDTFSSRGWCKKDGQQYKTLEAMINCYNGVVLAKHEKQGKSRKVKAVRHKKPVVPSVQYTYIAYTDGSNDNLNPKRPAGAAYIILDAQGKELHKAAKGFLNKTNNEMEMLAIISAVKWIPDGESIMVYSDSQYAINVFSGKWKAKKNLELVDLYRRLSAGKTVAFEWVKGHNGNYYNEIVDQMANAEYQKLR